jgi:hypothetical protein
MTETSPLTGRHILVARAGLRLKRETLAVAAGLPTHKLMEFELGRRPLSAETSQALETVLRDRYGAGIYDHGVTVAEAAPDEGADFRMARAALGKTVKEIVAMRGSVAYETLLSLENAKPVREASAERMFDFYDGQGVNISFLASVEWSGMVARQIKEETLT